MGRFLRKIKRKVKAKIEKLTVDNQSARDIFEEQKRKLTLDLS